MIRCRQAISLLAKKPPSRTTCGALLINLNLNLNRLLKTALNYWRLAGCLSLREHNERLPRSSLAANDRILLFEADTAARWIKSRPSELLFACLRSLTHLTRLLLSSRPFHNANRELGVAPRRLFDASRLCLQSWGSKKAAVKLPSCGTSQL